MSGDDMSMIQIQVFKEKRRFLNGISFSNKHSLLVEKVRNLVANYVSPQHHLVFEDFYHHLEQYVS
ncbi:hypothetical protein ACHAXS_009408 [Conticribra weissflogii]